MKSQIDRFSSPKLDYAESSGATFKRNNSEEKLEQSEETDQLQKTENLEEKSQFYGKLKTDYDETIYNVLTMKEKGFIKDDLPIRTGCFSPDGMYFSVGTNTKSIKMFSLDDILESLKPEEETGDLTSMRANEEIPVRFDHLNYHDGSIY